MNKIQISFNIVDAFVIPDKPAFSGNPAAVILLPIDEIISDEAKQKIASEFNLSETVYVSRSKTPDSQFVIRWFTPANEVNLCGHATVAASYVLFNEDHIFSDIVDKSRPLTFRTKFNSHVQSSYEDGSIVLNFPLNDCAKVDETKQWPTDVQLAIVGHERHLSKIVDVQFAPNTKKLVVRLKNDKNNDFLLSLKPDFNKLLGIDTTGSVRGVIVTQKANFANDGVHFWSRYFAPWYGINEDPVTGSAHTVLAPYWSKVYKEESGQTIQELFAKQVSRRTGLLACQLANERVLIKGKARLFCKGTLADF